MIENIQINNCFFSYSKKTKSQQSVYLGFVPISFLFKK